MPRRRRGRSEQKNQGDLFEASAGGTEGPVSRTPPRGRPSTEAGAAGVVPGVRPPRADIAPLGREGRIRVGTSGYSFADWVGAFYHERTPKTGMLDEYVKHFDIVEINSSYYRVPSQNMFAGMERRTPDGFQFVVKLYKGMTHEIEDDAGMYAAFTDSVAPLKAAGKFAGYLAQFPWKFKRSDEAEEHLATLRSRLGDDPLFVEFRHDSWIDDATFRLLRDLGVGYCSVDEPRLRGLVPPVAEATGDTAYVRFHGRNAVNWWGRGGGDRYDYDYSRGELEEWSGKLLNLEAGTQKVYAFFNNCHAGHAARNAELMMELLGGELG